MSVEILDCEQNSDEWIRARLGIPTASNFAAILAKGEGKTRRSYMLKLAGEIITGEPTESYTNGFMERGHVMEPDARNLYAFANDIEPELVGFIHNDVIGAGASPDALLGNDGILEIKTKRSDLLIDVLIKGEFPVEHKAQCQGALWIAEREWIDLVCYWPGLPLFVKRAYRDEKYIGALTSVIEIFTFELQQTVKWVREYGRES